MRVRIISDGGGRASGMRTSHKSSTHGIDARAAPERARAAAEMKTTRCNNKANVNQRAAQ